MAAEKKPEVVPTFTPRTKEEIAQALAERKALSTMLVPSAEPAGQRQTPADVRPVHYAEPQRPATPPAPAVDVRPAEQAKKEKLALIDAKVLEIRKAEVELEQQKKNAADLVEQMRLERMALANQKEKLEQEVQEIQRGIAAAEAQQLAEQALHEQALRPQAERLPLEQWRAKFREALVPLVTRIVSGLVKLRTILKENGATLETVAALRTKPGLDGGTHSEYIAVSEGAKKILGELHDHILQHERALAHAEDFVADPRSPDGRSAVNGLRRELENVSGMVTGRLVDIVNPRADVNPHNGIEGQTPASLDLAERIGSVLEQYAKVQKRANAVARPMPEIVIEIIPKSDREAMAALRGPKPPESTHADGVPEGV